MFCKLSSKSNENCHRAAHECKHAHKRNLKLDFPITENNDTISTWRSPVVPSSRRLPRKKKKRRTKRSTVLQQSRLQRYMPSLEFSHIPFPTVARSKFLEREREFLYRFYPKKVAKKIDKYLPRSTSIIPPFLREGTRPLASRRSLVRTAIALYRGTARCFVSIHAGVRIFGVAAREKGMCARL